MKFGIWVKKVDPRRYDDLRFRVENDKTKMDIQEGEVLIFGSEAYWKIALILGDCLCFGDIECAIKREDSDEQEQETEQADSTVEE